MFISSSSFPTSPSYPPFPTPPRLTHSGIYFPVWDPRIRVFSPCFPHSVNRRCWSLWSHLGVSVSDSCSVAVLAELLKTWSHIAQHSLTLFPPPMLLFGVLFLSQLLSERHLLSPTHFNYSQKTFIHTEWTNYFKCETIKRNTNSWIKF